MSEVARQGFHELIFDGRGYGDSFGSITTGNPSCMRRHTLYPLTYILDPYRCRLVSISLSVSDVFSSL